jgi:nucleoside-diphosphate-sugar epimerase
MRLLITGNQGYVGSALVPHLRSVYPDAELIGVDAGWFANRVFPSGRHPETYLDKQLTLDVRDLTSADLKHTDAVVHLAAVSNDAVGDRYASATDEINHVATARLAANCARAGVRHFVFPSSCSVYGAAGDGHPRKETDPTGPLTSYARSKVAAERALSQVHGPRITCLRFATACGASPRLRPDLVLNTFVISARLEGVVHVHGTGELWRPLIDVADMCRAVEWALGRAGPRFLVVNVGADKNNCRVVDIARVVAPVIPTRIAFVPYRTDHRSYRVDFGLYSRLAPDYIPRVWLPESVFGVDQMIGGFGQTLLPRLDVVDDLVACGSMTKGLRWA